MKLLRELILNFKNTKLIEEQLHSAKIGISNLLNEKIAIQTSVNHQISNLEGINVSTYEVRENSLLIY